MWFHTLIKLDSAITIDSTIYTDERLFKEWNADNPDNEFIKRPDRTHLLDIDRKPTLYLVAKADNRLVGYAGWIDEGSYVKIAGIRVHPDFRLKGIFGNLWNARDKKVGMKPSIAFTNITTMPIDIFISKLERYGYDTKGYDVNKVEGIPKEIPEAYLEKYGNFLVKNA
tara:strand:+ start:131 stop:637 length:507 start_codon:yes stop_codon:yes gene_type:complete